MIVYRISNPLYSNDISGTGAKLHGAGQDGRLADAERDIEEQGGDAPVVDQARPVEQGRDGQRQGRRQPRLGARGRHAALAAQAVPPPDQDG